MLSKLHVTPEQKQKDAYNKLTSALFGNITPDNRSSTIKSISFNAAQDSHKASNSRAENQPNICTPIDASHKKAPRKTYSILKNRFTDFKYPLELVCGQVNSFYKGKDCTCGKCKQFFKENPCTLTTSGKGFFSIGAPTRLEKIVAPTCTRIFWWEGMLILLTLIADGRNKNGTFLGTRSVTVSFLLLVAIPTSL